MMPSQYGQAALGSAEPAIEIEGASIVFERGGKSTIAVDAVSLRIARGAFVCLLGPSGCGKSTLLNAIAGFEPLRSGTIRVSGSEVVGPGPDRAVVFQQPNLFPWKSARDNIAHGPRMAGHSKAEALRQADALIDMVGLGRFAGAYPHELSGGMQQRVAIARALATRPGILLMDEPFGALDAQTRSIMQDNLLRLWPRISATIVFVTHDIEEAILLADRILVMSAGPGRILREIAVDLPRPRSVDLAVDPHFLALKKECLDLIRQESRHVFEADEARPGR
ncbi:ABC transporter ATP-binding protein [Methylobacterium sp. E-045]|uniref:ABC transporter ATP-binding protein n=1 Tax=Methylobacterium sp. E-045 TaxID=2836575 RepID=UPI001FBAC128|nr:ABC transporter ATP-binding protein [Methylobacterium sp. E-045]MCJ2128163.1 ABC transporter ATP-binding protein [Methylobacterium sp. E-045]